MRTETNLQTRGDACVRRQRNTGGTVAKKRMSRGTRVLVIIVCVLAAVAAVGAVLFCGKKLVRAK